MQNYRPCQGVGFPMEALGPAHRSASPDIDFSKEKSIHGLFQRDHLLQLRAMNWSIEEIENDVSASGC